MELGVNPGDFELGGESYASTPGVPVRLDISRTTGNGYALRLRFGAQLVGPCMRCLIDAAPEFTVDAREVSQPGAGEELESPYVTEQVLDLAAWAHDALALAVGGSPILCRADCAGLCPACGIELADAGPEHRHDSAPDPRWAKLSELSFE